MTNEEMMAWLDDRVKRYPSNEGLRNVRTRVSELMRSLDFDKITVSREAWLDLELKRKEQQIVVLTLDLEKALKREFNTYMDFRCYKAAIGYASLWRRIRYAITGEFR